MVPLSRPKLLHVLAYMASKHFYINCKVNQMLKKDINIIMRRIRDFFQSI